MGVKGLQSFVERCCPEACVTVNVREMARRRAVNSQQDGTSSSHSTSWVYFGGGGGRVEGTFRSSLKHPVHIIINAHKTID